MTDTDGWKPGTAFPELFEALSRPFEPHQVKEREQAGRKFRYITARTAMNRLDSVLGPENWWDVHEAHENSVLCKLTIRLPDGSTITKQDAGGYAGMADQGDDEKSGYSDAFKRACVKFGIARYLYKDGVPAFAGPDANQSNYSRPAAPVHADARPPAPESRPSAPGLPNPPASGKALFAAVRDLEKTHDSALIRPLNDWARGRGHKDRMVDWPREFIDEAWAFVGELVAKVAPQGPAPAASHPQPTNGTVPDVSLKDLRDEFWGFCFGTVCHLFKVPNGQEPDPGKVYEECDRVASMLTPGRKLPSLAELSDADDLRRLIDAAGKRYQEVISDVVPY